MTEKNWENKKVLDYKSFVIGGLIVTIIGGGLVALNWDKMKIIEEKTQTIIQENTLTDLGKTHESDNLNSQEILNNLPSQELSEDEKNGLLLMREEEKLARDVYKALYEKWDQNIFSNISKSEETHTNTIKNLLEKYNLEDPMKNDNFGVFENSTLQSLYNDLVAKGSTSLVDGLKVGATVEDLDIKDLQDLLAKTDNEDIQTAYQNLIKGSRNHLRSFVSTLNKNGETYTPQYISQADFEQIILSAKETGSVDSKGKNRGK